MNNLNFFVIVIFSITFAQVNSQDEKIIFPEDSQSDEAIQSRFSYNTGYGAKGRGVKTKQNSLTPEDYKKMQSGYDQGGGYSTYKKTSSYSSSSSKNGYAVDPGLVGSSESIESGGRRGCSYDKIRPMNAAKRCKNSECDVTCMNGYEFPNGRTKMQAKCVGNEWIVTGSELSTIPACKPVCAPKCLNNGICMEPGVCTCPDNFMGPYCQQQKIYCLTPAPLPGNSKRACTEDFCQIDCLRGFKFPDGTNQTGIQCLNGQWIPKSPGWTTIPDCKPTCSPPCQNGGKCLSLNTCQCAQEFRGPQCQYSIENCSPKKINFNGGYNCTGTGDELSCSLYCPAGVKFDFPPARFYTCTYGVGKFFPEKIPKCSFSSNMKVMPQAQSSHTMYKVSNSTMTKQGSRKQLFKSQEEEDGEDDEEEIITEIKTIVTRKKIKNKKSYGYYVTDDEGDEQQIPGVYVMSLNQDLDVVYNTAKPSVCMTYNGMKVRTFDGLVYNADLFCSQTLVQDYIDGEFAIILRACPYDVDQPCPHALEIFLQNERYTFEKKDKRVSFFSPKKTYSIPVQLTGIKVTRAGSNVRISLDALDTTIIWDTKKLVQIEASAALWNRTAGLCGTMDGDIKNDFMSKDGQVLTVPGAFVDSWKTPELDKDKNKCTMARSQKTTNPLCEPSIEAKATEVCNKLIKNPKLKSCVTNFNAEALMRTCISDYCTCKLTANRQQCACNGISVLAKDCQYQGVKLVNGWRDLDICPVECPSGRVYLPCGPQFEKTCGSTVSDSSAACQEGCFCPNSKWLHNGTCVDLDRCPCKLRAKEFPPGAKIQRDCNMCACENGEWKCSDLNCGARCSAIGDPHYVTFDGKHYSFMGKCSYYLLKTADVTVEAENVPCHGTISELAGYSPAISNEIPSCTKSVTIKFADGKQIKTIKLNQGMQVLVEDLEITTLPKKMMNGLLKIKKPSESFIVVDFQGGLKIWWDGQTRVYIDAPASFRGKTQGLCGTFNANLQDDFLTPEGDVETAVAPFADKWRTKESCPLMSDGRSAVHSCTLNLSKKDKATEICSKLLASVFDECNWLVDHETFYEDCMYDVCACQADPSVCACPVIASYAAECARQGNVVDWRQSITECAVKCPGGQVYEQCGDACSRTCDDLQSEQCKLQCVEGCRCPNGQVLDESNQCVPINRCACLYKGLKYKSGHKEVRPGNRGLDLCICSSAKWMCQEAKPGDAEKYPAADDIRTKCLAKANEEFTTCEPTEVLTCKNMHVGVQSTPAECQPGCVCKKGYVLDASKKKCVLPDDCSCHHGGRSYNDGEKMKEECNTCTCKSGNWSCSTLKCAATCSAWGDSHFETFDGKHYDFQGVCTYILTKGALPDGNSYSVTIQNVLCGSFGVTCTKSVEIKLMGQNPQTVKLTEDTFKANINQIESNDIAQSSEPKPLFIYRSGVFVIVEAPGLGLQLKWDRGTRIYVKLDNRWKGRVQGLCGNYNLNGLDDFQTPSLGLESSALAFGHSWKLQNFCEMPTEQSNACEQQPHRKIWSQRKCGILKTEMFSACHSEVPVENFLKRCVFDACACDQGGDCECLCTALAAYAHACAMRNVIIKWRTPELCPMQCDGTCSEYEACISPCPVETCDNWLYKEKEMICKQDTCVEGCGVKKCEPGMIYKNDSLKECVPKSVCKPICLMQDGVTYYEGDIMNTDACRTCICTKGKEKCSGVPCTTESLVELFTPTKPTILKPTTEKPGDYEDKTITISQKPSTARPMKLVSSTTAPPVKPDKPKLYPDPEVNEAKEKTICDPSIPHVEYPGDCYKFKHCVPLGDGSYRYAIKTCGPTMMFSPSAMVCVWPADVIAIKPYCASAIIQDKTTTAPKKPSSTTQMKYIASTTPVPGKPDKPKVYHDSAPITQNPILSEKSTPKPPKPVVLPDDETEEANETPCDPSTPHVEFPGDCHKFKHCMPMVDGTYKYAIKTCGGPMMYNPNAMVCDWPAAVISIKPNCGDSVPTTSKPTTKLFGIPEKLTDTCDPAVQLVEFPGDCSKFKHCVKKDGAYRYVVKSCGEPTLYNPKTKTCDSPASVKAIKPACDIAPAPITQKPTLSEKSTPKPWKPIIFPDGETDEANETPCNPSTPHVEFPGDCHKFKHCMPMADGTFKYAIKTCGEAMMYNPHSMVCDWPASVIEIKPICGKPTKPATKYSKPVTISPIVQTEESIKSECKLADPYNDYPGDCNKFRQCMPMLDGSYKYTIKSCQANMMYNPISKICDWPKSVIAIKPECDEANNKLEPLVENQLNINKNCPPGTIWSDCAAPCGRSCHYYAKVLKQSGDCLTEFDECKSGCIQDNYTANCPAGQVWRDGKTCVNIIDCTCMSNDGKMIKPNAPNKESECKKCQCMNNVYACMDLPCPDKDKPTTSTVFSTLSTVDYEWITTPNPTRKPNLNTTVTTPLYLLPSTVAPPLRCAAENLVPLIDGETKLPDSAFSAATFLSPQFKPEFGRLDTKTNGKSSGSWSPAINDQMQYLQITFPTVTPVYGVIMRGNSFLNQFVTSFKILHSFDGVGFHYLYDESKTPQIFRGPADSNTKASSLFKIPIEAKAIRIYPLTWHKSIAIRTELLGCASNIPIPTQKPVVQPSTTVKPLLPIIEEDVIPMCDDPMGVENGQLEPTQIKVSSSKLSVPGVKTAAIPLKPYEALKMTAKQGWQPIMDSPNEFVVFDFLEPRNLTGVKTKGGRGKWVTAYNVLYSKDDKVWNKIMQSNGEPKQFLGNVDPQKEHTNYFPKPIRAQYLKVSPVKWHEGIEMQVEPLGCFKPYPESKEVEEVEEPQSNCTICKGVSEPQAAIEGVCPCHHPFYWNGQECLAQEDCPCMEGYMPYDVGIHYEKDDCSECVCTLGGIALCTPKVCATCPKGLRTVHSNTCACLCKPCPEGQLMCPTNGACILEELWCDNFEDCPDDEVNCVKKLEPEFKETTNQTTTTTISKTCPDPKCPPGFQIRVGPPSNRRPEPSPMFQSGVKGRPSKGSSYGKKINSNTFDSNLSKPSKISEAPVEKCMEFKCVPDQVPGNYTEEYKKVVCPEKMCPKRFEIVEEPETAPGECTKFTCKPIVLPDVVCNVTGRIFNTFDGTEFKYDICHHVLARDFIADKWSLTMRKFCPTDAKICTKYVVIRDKPANFILSLFPNMTVDLNGYKFTVQQLQKSPTKRSFAVSKVGKNIIFVSHAHDFSVSMDKFGDTKIGLSSKFTKTVDGLCGFYNGKSEDDKRMPNGLPAQSTLEFGDSWLLDEKSKETCEPHVCPKHLQDFAWNMCNAVKQQTFQKCAKIIDADRFVSKCMETACECLQASTDSAAAAKLTKDTVAVKACKCLMLESYVTECMATDESVQLDTWRSAEQCEVKCAAPLVYKDCYRRRCEPSCDNIKSDDCPRLPGNCFPGCYCPDGMVKNGLTCVPVSECRDCVCDGLGKSQYLTYDQRNFTFGGNCTYLLTRNVNLDNIPTFQVYTTIGPCGMPAGNSKKVPTCTQALHILYGSHIIHIQRGLKGKKPTILIDGVNATAASWLKITEEKGMFLKLVIPESQLEITSSFEDMTFTIRVPSSKYGKKMEGLCGDCNGDPNDDLKPNNAKLQTLKPSGNSIKDFAMSWQSDEPKVNGDERMCIVEDEADCLPLPPDTDPCFKILDENLFGKCHFLVNPAMYVSACQQDLCKLGPDQKGACNTLAAYARECARNGICVNWRLNGLCTYECPANLLYESCGCAKTCEMVKKSAAFKPAVKGKPAPQFSCPIDKVEGCFCPKGKLLHNGKCIADTECNAPCDALGHLPGDVWYPDKCTECKCNNATKTICSKKDCAVKETICASGMTPLEVTKAEDCCKQFVCVPVTTPRPLVKCPDPQIPTCTAGQIKKTIMDAAGCQQIICECKPASECEPLQQFSAPLNPGMKKVVETKSCCPTAKLVCDKTLCPTKPKACTEALFELLPKPATLDSCCDEWECVSPKNMCVLTVEGKTLSKNINEKWPTTDPCWSKMCVYGPDGKPTVKDEKQMCSVKCDPGQKYVVESGKCCGQCVREKCVIGDKLYSPGEVWYGADNCTTFKCNLVDNNILISSQQETCPDITKCPEQSKYKKGCCTLCKMETAELKNCLPEPIATKSTVGLVRKRMGTHGMCKNIVPIQGFNECVGSCSSGSKYNPDSFQQEKKCDCCSISAFKELDISLVCDDGYVFKKKISVPSACSCLKCSEKLDTNDLA